MNIENLKSDTELLEQVEKAGSAEEIAELLRARGLEVTDENAQAAYEYKVKAQSGELNEEALDEVAGGGIITGIVVGWTVVNVAVHGTAFALSKFTSKWK